MNFLFSCLWLIGIALFLPVDLPAGGRSLCKSSMLVSSRDGIFFAGDSCNLYTSPSLKSNLLSTIRIGSPIRVLRTWDSPLGNQWMQVESLGGKRFGMPGEINRGWINV